MKNNATFFGLVLSLLPVAGFSLDNDLDWMEREMRKTVSEDIYGVRARNRTRSARDHVRPQAVPIQGSPPLINGVPAVDTGGGNYLDPRTGKVHPGRQSLTINGVPAIDAGGGNYVDRQTGVVYHRSGAVAVPVGIINKGTGKFEAFK
jgi:hypothetical protein